MNDPDADDADATKTAIPIPPVGYSVDALTLQIERSHATIVACRDLLESEPFPFENPDDPTRERLARLFVLVELTIEQLVSARGSAQEVRSKLRELGRRTVTP